MANVALTVLASAIALGACSSSQQDGALEAGPLNFGGGAGELCLSVPPQGSAVIGDTLTAPQGKAMTIDRVELVNPVGMIQSAAYIIPLASDDASIGGDTYPPSTSSIWSRRVALAGAVVEPGKHVNVVIVTRRENSTQATSTGIRIVYQIQSEYAKVNTTSYVLKNSCT